MYDFIIKETKPTLNIILKAYGIMTFSGHSIPEHGLKFHPPILKWLEDYFKDHSIQKTTFNIDIKIFNASTLIFFFDLFDFLDEKSEKYLIEINWLYDERNSEAFEIGIYFKDEFDKLTISLIKK